MNAARHGEDSTILRIRVPASSSNLGPGFDQLGLALELYLEVELHGPIVAAEHELCLEGEHARQWPTRENRLCQALDAVLCGTSLEGEHYRLVVRSEVPLCRGLGSSGAATAAGLVLAAELLQRESGSDARPSAAQLDALGLALEGHPDNVIASLHGGCTLGIPLPHNRLRVLQQPVHTALLFVVVWPRAQLSTAAARDALPDRLPFADVIWSTRRLSLLLEGLRSADPELLKHGARDRLHTPYRLPLIDGAEEALQAARNAGALLAAISGSGSALIAAHTDESAARAIGAAMQSALDKRRSGAEARVLRLARVGAQIF